MSIERIIDKMRADWPVVEEDRITSGQWSQADADEVGAAIKAAIDANDTTTILLWARWMADLSAIALGLRVSHASKRILEEARAARQGGAS